MALELTFDRSLPRSVLAEDTGFLDLPPDTAHAFARFQRYQKVSWDVRDVPVGADWGWGPCVDEGPILLDGLSLVPIMGGHRLQEALGSPHEADKHLDVWVGVVPDPCWVPSEGFQEDHRRGQEAFGIAETNSWKPETLVAFRQIVDNSRVANACSLNQKTLLGVLLEQHFLSSSPLIVQGIEWLLAHGATTKSLSRSRNRGPETPWAYLLEHTLPNPQVLDPEKEVSPFLLKAFLDGDLDVSSTTHRVRTQAWVARHTPGLRPTIDPLMVALSGRLLEAAWDKGLSSPSRRPRF